MNYSIGYQCDNLRACTALHHNNITYIRNTKVKNRRHRSIQHQFPAAAREHKHWCEADLGPAVHMQSEVTGVADGGQGHQARRERGPLGILLSARHHQDC